MTPGFHRSSPGERASLGSRLHPDSCNPCIFWFKDKAAQEWDDHGWHQLWENHRTPKSWMIYNGKSQNHRDDVGFNLHIGPPISLLLNLLAPGIVQQGRDVRLLPLQTPRHRQNVEIQRDSERDSRPCLLKGLFSMQITSNNWILHDITWCCLPVIDIAIENGAFSNRWFSDLSMVIFP